jgi:hypothetical protein
MNSKMRVILALIIVIAGVMTYRHYHQQERRILRSFRNVCALVEVRERENMLKAGLRVDRVLPFFTPDASLSSDTLAARGGAALAELQHIMPSGSRSAHIHGRDEVRAVLLLSRTMMDRLSIRILDHTIEVLPDGNRAEMTVTLRLTARRGQQSGSSEEDQRITWVKEDGRWLIHASETHSTIRRPGAES